MTINLQSVKAFLFQEIANQRKSLFLWSPVFMGAGIVTYFTSDTPISWMAIGLIATIVVAALSKSLHKYAKTGHFTWLVIMLFFIAIGLFSAGYSSAKFRQLSIETVLLEKDLNPRLIEGHIEKLVPLDGGKAKQVILKNVNVDDKTYRVRLKTYHFKGDDWSIGDKVSVKAKLMAPSSPVMPNGFDFRQKAFYEGISAVGYTMSDATVIQKDSAPASILGQIRSKIGSHLYQFMGDREAGVAQALLTGERAGIGKDDAEAFRASGLAHLLAISGLHIGLVAGCVFFFLRLGLACIPNMALHYPIKKWAASCAIVIAFCYMLLAGATVPTVRAFIMTSLVLFAVILDRSALNMRLVAIAALFVMITTPEAIIGPSFVLSFSAVAALIVFYRDVGRKWLINANAYKPLWRPVYYLFGVIVTSLVATLATAPFSVMFFNRFAVYSMVSNIIAMPLMAFVVMPVGLMATLLIPFGMDDHLWVMMEWGIANILTVAESITAYEHASLYLSSFGSYETLSIIVGFIFLVLWRGYLRMIGLLFITLAFVHSCSARPRAILISDDMKSILYVDKSVDNLFLIGKMNSYLKQNWLGFYGYEPDVDMIHYKDGDNIDKSTGFCDDFFCRFNINGTIVSILINPVSMEAACANSEILIADIPVGKDQCHNPDTIIDRFYIWRHGATSVTFNDDGTYDIKTVK